MEYQKYKKDIEYKGKETVRYLNENNLKGIVLAGRPYHMDPEINHGIDTLITSLGLAVLTEDLTLTSGDSHLPGILAAGNLISSSGLFTIILVFCVLQKLLGFI